MLGEVMTVSEGGVAGGGSGSAAGVIASLTGLGNSDGAGVSGIGIGSVTREDVDTLTCCRIGERLKPPCSAIARSMVNGQRCGQQPLYMAKRQRHPNRSKLPADVMGERTEIRFH